MPLIVRVELTMAVHAYMGPDGNVRRSPLDAAVHDSIDAARAWMDWAWPFTPVPWQLVDQVEEALTCRW